MLSRNAARASVVLPTHVIATEIADCPQTDACGSEMFVHSCGKLSTDHSAIAAHA
jgi:hypothetical protein